MVPHHHFSSTRLGIIVSVLFRCARHGLKRCYDASQTSPEWETVGAVFPVPLGWYLSVGKASIEFHQLKYSVIPRLIYHLRV